MDFDRTRPAPHERSIFRKHLRRALLRRRDDSYLGVWEIDFTSSNARKKFGHRRNILKERQVEEEVTRLLRGKFCFRFVSIEGLTRRMGPGGLEAALIGTVARCPLCRPSKNWLGLHSPAERVRQGGLWQIQHRAADPMSREQRRRFWAALKKTKRQS
jgi:hypothetical protein